MSKQACYVYAIGAKWTGLVKVGVSFNPSGRVSTFQTGNPFLLELWAAFKLDSVDDARLIEGEFHELNNECRIMGEWFQFPDSDYAPVHLRDQILAQFGEIS